MHLYALCDQELLDKHNISIDEFISIAKNNNAEIVQYRNKRDDLSFVKNKLIYIKKIYDGILVVDDFYKLVEFCDGVHLGQEDLYKIDTNKEKAIKLLKQNMKKEKIIGLSTHNELEIIEANKLDVDYIGLGAYRATDTKNNISTVLGSTLDEIASKSKHPVAAIGGVRLDDKFLNVKYHVIGSGLLL